MQDETVLFQSKYSKAIFYRPLILFGICLIVFLVVIIVPPNAALSSFFLLSFVGMIYTLVNFLIRILRYMQNTFVVTDKRVIVTTRGKEMYLPLDRIREVERDSKNKFPFPFHIHTLRIYGVGGSKAVYHEVENDEEMRQVIEGLLKKEHKANAG